MIRELKVQQKGMPFFIVDIPPTAIVTITKTCGGCGFMEPAACGNKPVCANNKIFAKRPYSTGPKGRSIDYDSIPDWCPLRTGECNP